MTSVCTLNFVAHVINNSDSVVLRMCPWRSWRTVNEPSYTNQQSPTVSNLKVRMLHTNPPA